MFLCIPYLTSYQHDYRDEFGLPEEREKNKALLLNVHQWTETFIDL